MHIFIEELLKKQLLVVVVLHVEMGNKTGTTKQNKKWYKNVFSLP